MDVGSEMKPNGKNKNTQRADDEPLKSENNVQILTAHDRRKAMEIKWICKIEEKKKAEKKYGNLLKAI